MKVQIRTYSPTCLLVETALTVSGRVRSVGWNLSLLSNNLLHFPGVTILEVGHKFAHYRCPFISSSRSLWSRKRELTQFREYYFLLLLVRKEGTAEFPEWIPIHRYQMKGSGNLFPKLTLHLSLQDKEMKLGRRKRIVVYLCAFNTLSCLRDCYSVSPISMHNVLAALVWSRWDSCNSSDFPSKVLK